MKTEHSAVAAQYANAVIQLAEKERVEQKLQDDLHLINEAVSSSSEFDLVLRHPGFTPAQKKELIVKLFSGKVHDLTLRLLELLVDRRRLELLPYIEAEFLKLWREKRGLVLGTLTYAEKPDSKTLNEIKERLAKQLGKTIELNEKEDKSLIGGYVLRIGDQVIDGSVKGRLQTIEKSLMSV